MLVEKETKKRHYPITLLKNGPPYSFKFEQLLQDNYIEPKLHNKIAQFATRAKLIHDSSGLIQMHPTELPPQAIVYFISNA
jgi:hypothetical protein